MILLPGSVLKKIPINLIMPIVPEIWGILIGYRLQSRFKK